MRLPKISVSPQFLLLYALLFFFDNTGLVSALVPACAIHETGHMIALVLCGCGIRNIKMCVSGFTMDYSGVLSKKQEIFCALMGPFFGLLWSLAAISAGKSSDSVFLICSAYISFLLSVFNLIPTLPMDGGRVLCCVVGEKAAYTISTVLDVVLMLLGLYLISRGYGTALLFAGLWLILYSCKSGSDDVK